MSSSFRRTAARIRPITKLQEPPPLTDNLPDHRFGVRGRSAGRRFLGTCERPHQLSEPAEGPVGPVIEYLTLEDILSLVEDLGVGPIGDIGLLDSAVHRPRVSV